MALLEIPQEYEPSLEKLINLSDESLEEVFSALEKIPLSIRYRSVAHRAATQIKAVSEADLEGIIEVAVALNYLRESATVTITEFLEDVLEGMDEAASANLKLTGDAREKFKRKLARLLEAKTLEIASKGRVLLRDHPHTFCSAKLLSDLRPIFGEDVKATPRAAMVVHSLKLTYHHSDQLKDFYVSMTTEDVKTLRALLERADEKGENLKAVLGTTAVPYVDAEKDED